MYIAMRAQAAQASGELVHETKPTSIVGCGYSFDARNSSFSIVNDDTDKSFQLHHISYFYFSILASATTVIVAFIATLIERDNDPTTVDPKLLAPFMRKFFLPVGGERMEATEHVFDIKDNKLVMENVCDKGR